MDRLTIFYGLAIPAMVAAIVLFAARALRLLGPAGRRTLAIGCAYAAGYLLVAGWPGFPPASSTGWILWLSVVAAFAAWALGASAFPAPRRRFFACAAAAAIPSLLLRPLFTVVWSSAQSASMLALCSLACLGGWFASLRLERESPPAPILGHLALCAAGAAAVIALSGSIGLARLAGALAAGTATVALLARVQGREASGAGSVVLVLGILAAILIAAAAYADLPWWGAACLWLSTLAGWAPRLGPFTRLANWKRSAVMLIVTVALIAAPFIAALLETLAMERAMQGE